MLPTIPFKRHDADSQDTQTKSSSKKTSRTVHNTQPTLQKQSHTQERVAKTTPAPKKRLSLWVIVLIVAGVAIVGIVVLRFSRASGTEPMSIPLNQSDLQNFVNTQIAGQSNSPLNVSGYAQFQFGAQVPNATQVAYYIDQELVETRSSKPYTFVLDTTRLANGSHQLTAIAFDSTNSPVAATTRTIQVSNSDSLLQRTKNVVTYPWYALFNL